ncbi:hypothetical protein N1851_011098 [Merluccius polli]|uniref:Myb/SANT-like DNA-binding domain-containing protein n=1 Tax=Merluccius polli TaxID=89951 RepID=A0AA47MYR2_MERPO|nr:hypothetical protein N1851_011098 [Merluccius polli]
MATKKPRSSYFSSGELEILMTAYAESEHILLNKSNSVAAAKERELAWRKIADRVNACNPPTGTKRTWNQLKMKYKNIVQSANRKKAALKKTGGGPPLPPPLTEAEETALGQSSGRPVAEGISGGSQSDPAPLQDTGAYITFTDGVIRLINPSAITDLHAGDNDEDTVSAAIKREDVETPVESKIENGNYNVEEGPSTSTEQLTSSTEQLTSLPVKQLYKVYLQSQIDKSNLEMEHIRLQMTKTKMEMQLLDHQLKVGDVPTESLVISQLDCAAPQLEKSVCIGAMFWSKAAYWESPALASLSCLAAWESWKAASGWAESGSRVHSLSRRSPTPFRSSRKPKANAAFRRRFSSWRSLVKGTSSSQREEKATREVNSRR